MLNTTMCCSVNSGAFCNKHRGPKDELRLKFFIIVHFLMNTESEYNLIYFEQ